jgi:hypothetical protein
MPTNPRRIFHACIARSSEGGLTNVDAQWIDCGLPDVGVVVPTLYY